MPLSACFAGYLLVIHYPLRHSFSLIFLLHTYFPQPTITVDTCDDAQRHGLSSRFATSSQLQLQLLHPSSASARGWRQPAAGCAGLVAGTSIFFHLAKKGNQAEAARGVAAAEAEVKENMQQILIQNTHANFSNSHA